MKISLKELKLKHACACDLARFEKLFGDQVEVTAENCLLAVKGGLNLGWAAEKFFTATAREAYEKATAPAFYGASLMLMRRG